MLWTKSFDSWWYFYPRRPNHKFLDFRPIEWETFLYGFSCWFPYQFSSLHDVSNSFRWFGGMEIGLQVKEESDDRKRRFFLISKSGRYDLCTAIFQYVEQRNGVIGNHWSKITRYPPYLEFLDVRTLLYSSLECCHLVAQKLNLALSNWLTILDLHFNISLSYQSSKYSSGDDKKQHSNFRRLTLSEWSIYGKRLAEWVESNHRGRIIRLKRPI